MTIRCASCGLFCVPDDECTPFGCKNYDYPEPLDPDYYCKNCFSRHKDSWYQGFISGNMYGHWQKSRAEQEAANDAGLIWIHSNGIGKYGTKEHKMYCYVTQEEYDRLTNKRTVSEAFDLD